jgi:hypothetical protein
MPVYLLPSGSFFEHVIAWLAPFVRFLYGIEPPPPVRTPLEQAWADLFPELIRWFYVCVVLRVAWVTGWNLFPVVSNMLTRAREHLNQMWIEYGPSFIIVCPNVAAAA